MNREEQSAQLIEKIQADLRFLNHKGQYHNRTDQQIHIIFTHVASRESFDFNSNFWDDKRVGELAEWYKTMEPTDFNENASRLHQNYARLTLSERSFVDRVMRRIFSFQAELKQQGDNPPPLYGDDRAEKATDGIAEWVIACRYPAGNAQVTAEREAAAKK